ncbi:unnamed protein product [Symbiodinium sp. CCMP2592]|nr:unnamed protein product [Symbiodinium sp. CCMP2592]CAE7258687.1 unnamed protein product [Symbiodinium sp. CCMP2592]
MARLSIAVPEQIHTCGALAGSTSEIPKLIYWVALAILRKNQYDLVEEFWVTIRETGTHEESVTKEEKRYSSEKARFGIINQGDDKPMDLGSAFSGLAAMQGRQDADNRKMTADEKFSQIKSTLKKFVDSIVQKSNKMKGLVKELRENFTDSGEVQKSIKDLEGQVQKMEHQYEKCNELQAACSSAVRTARNVVRDFGDAAASSGGLIQLSKCSDTNAERDTHRLLTKRLHLSLETYVPLRSVTQNGNKLTILHLQDWMRFLLQKNCFHIVTGLVRPDEARQEAILHHFWKNFELSHSSHPIYDLARQGKVVLERTAPILFHGDEGRGRRRQPFLVTSWSSILGRGTAPSDRFRKKHGIRNKFIKHRTNFIGHSFTNRFLQAGWPKKAYEEESAFDRLLRCCKRDNDVMLHEGLVDKRTGKRYFAIVLAVVGDWQWLVKAGKLARSYNHVVKNTAKQAKHPEGICHLCQAGQKDQPFETFQTRSPGWLQTFCVQDPFLDARTPLATLPHMPGQAATLFKYDVFHTCHLGICKALVGSGLALLSLTFPGRGKDARMEQVSNNFMEWCKNSGRQPLLTKLTKESILWDTNADYPVGSWYKASLSTTLCEYIEDVTKDKTFQDVLLMKCSEAVQALNKFLTGLYEADVFLTSEQAYTLGEYGLLFLRRYSFCAGEAARQGRCLFLILPKMHCLQHICLQDLVLASRRFSLVLNPLCFSVQLCEDYVGRNSRASRRVHPTTCTLRVAQRHLQLAYSKYIAAGYLVDDSAQMEK